MRKQTLIIAFAAIVACVILFSHRTSAQNAIEKPQPQKWEYKVLHITKMIGDAKEIDGISFELEKSLNNLGDEGWELCLEINGGVVLKRQQ